MKITKTPKPFFILAIGCALLVLFVLETYSIVSHALWVEKWDTFIIAHIRHTITPALTFLMRFLTHLGSTETIAILSIFIIIILFWNKYFRLGLWFGGTIIIFGVLLKYLKVLLARPRPDSATWLAHASGFSYPSGHASATSLFCTLIALFLIANPMNISTKIFIGLLALAMTFLIMFSRIYLGVHYPTDVLGGFLSGGGIGFIGVGSYLLFLPSFKRAKS
ncbi:phosphatase PAP2 family protein [Helicobacter sp. 11S03491-1]|uniref:phosphatase PAP2 family protein n=1 Tax=Helicobacter sp. 11S03491-1 TaxID=1476196 RepID=UPI000BA5A73B|nr:phosphatase PAP2 family protein [Helicobacter sp. 11S03491-1]PAF43860.1 hypothetical protein BKH45_00940 [Helicobacter sp. 11S03491-1]